MLPAPPELSLAPHHQVSPPLSPSLCSTLEMSVVGFWGTTGLIIGGCFWVFWVLYSYTKRKRIL